MCPLAPEVDPHGWVLSSECCLHSFLSYPIALHAYIVHLLHKLFKAEESIFVIQFPLYWINSWDVKLKANVSKAIVFIPTSMSPSLRLLLAESELAYLETESRVKASSLS